jgi:cell division protein FtsB
VPVPDRFSTATRIRALGAQAQARVYRATGRGPSGPRRNRLTGRAAVLALVVCALVVALAYPMRQYIAQRSAIADQRRQAQEARQRVDQLREEKARWQDPAYVRSQARERLNYVLPGETGYTVVTPGATAQNSADRHDASEAAGRRPWYTNLWDGVDHADGSAPARAASN